MVLNTRWKLTYLGLVLQFKGGTAVEAALALHGAYNGPAALWGEVDSCHHLMHICPVHHPLVWNVPHAHLTVHLHNIIVLIIYYYVLLHVIIIYIFICI